LKRIIEAMKSPETTLQVYDQKFYFNKHDVTTEFHNLTEDYLKQEFGRLGYNYGKTLMEATSPHQQDEGLFLY